MEDISKFVLEVLKKNKGTISKEELKEKTHLSESELSYALNDLQKRFYIHAGKHNKYRLVQEKLTVGKITMVGDPSFVTVEDMVIPVEENHLNHAILGDYVLIRIRNLGHPTMDAIVDERLQHELGEIVEKDGIFYIKVDTKNNIEIKVENKEGLVPGMLVNFEYTKELDNTSFSGKVISIVGHISNPDSHFKKLVSYGGIETRFPNSVMQAVAVLPHTVSEIEKEGRVDLTKQTIFTIDGKDSKDFDDAVSITKKENGNYVLGVHIADVSHYVKEGSTIDEEASKRGSSVYFMNRVVPMLPHRLSNGICSLNPEVDRLTMTCEMEINKEGDVVDYHIFESVIHSKKRMRYDEVNKIFETDEKVIGYEPFLKDLKLMYELSLILHEKRKERGSIEFDVKEPYFIYDKYDRPIDVCVRERGISEHIIEEFMLVANTTVATMLKDYPVPRRVNPKPDLILLKNVAKSMESLKEVMDDSSYQKIEPILTEIKNSKKEDFIEPKKLQILLDTIRTQDENSIYAKLVLSGMKRAYYTTKEDMHYALALPDYTHFTSPIRRYPDLMIHRSIKQFLLRRTNDYDTIKSVEEKNEKLVKQISQKEKKIQKCERMIDSIKQAEYMKNHIGEVYDGYIEQISKSGLQVCFDDVISGKVPRQNLESYSYDGKTKTFQNQETQDTYHLGDKISVLVESINEKSSTIYLKPQKEKEKELILR